MQSHHLRDPELPCHFCSVYNLWKAVKLSVVASDLPFQGPGVNVLSKFCRVDSAGVGRWS